MSRYSPCTSPRRIRLATPAALLALAILATACGGGGGGGGTAGAMAPTLQSITVSPGSASVAKGLTRSFAATGHYSDASTQDLTALATWTSSSTAVASIAGPVATAIVEGTSTIAAAYGGKSGQATLTVGPAVLQSIAVDPATVLIPQGLTTTLVATGAYSDGSTVDLTASATWSSDNVLAASVVAGAVDAVGQGEAVVTAALDGRSGQAHVSVGAAALQAIALVPASLSVPKGLAGSLVATGHYTDGTDQDLTAIAVWSSAAPSVAAVDPAGVVSALALGTTTVSAGLGGREGTATVEVTAPVLQSIAVSPASASVAKGLTSSFTATGHYSDGSTQDLTGSATWSSSNVAVATVAGPVATGAGVGTTSISAVHGGKSGQASLTVTAPVVQAVTVAPASASVAKGLAQAFTATAQLSDATTEDVTATATWTTADPLVATAAGHVVTGLRVGSTEVQATAAGVMGSASITVTPPVVTAVTLSPVGATLAAGTSLQYDASAVLSDGTIEDVTATAAWASTPEAVATVTPGGLASGLSVGTATVSATVAGVNGSTGLTVTAAVLASLEISPTDPVVPLGVTQAFTATGVFGDGSRQDLTAQVAWTSDAEGVATISAAGVATPVAQGTATIGASMSTGGGPVTASTSITVTSEVLTAIVVDPPSATVAAGTPAAFTATGIYSDASTQDLTALVAWSSSDPAVATISNAAGTEGAATTAAAGAATITASLGGVSGAATLNVTAAVLVSVAVTPTTTTIPKGFAQPFTATGTFSDGSTQDLTASAGWTSSDPGIAAVSNTAGEQGRVTGVEVGTATITATFESIGGSSSVTVSGAALAGIDVTSATSTVPTGYTVRHQATARYTDGSTQVVTTLVTWSSSDVTIATISNAAGTQGLATGVTAGTATITAMLSGTSGSASLEVVAATLQSVAVSPAAFTIPVGGTVQLVALGTFAGGLTIDVTRQCTWSVPPPSRRIATVSKNGLVTGVAPGAVTVTAKRGNKSGTASGTVTP